MTDSTLVTSALTAMHIPRRLFRHPGLVQSLEQAARERGQQPEQVVRSIVFRLGEGDYLMVLMAGPRQISWPVLRRYLGQSRLTLASEAEVLEATGYPLGAVSPFLLSGDIPYSTLPFWQGCLFVESLSDFHYRPGVKQPQTSG